MAQNFEIHPENPQPRLIKQVALLLKAGKVGAIPTDSCYALVCHIGDKQAQERISQIRQLEKRHHFTLLCADLSELGAFAQVSKNAYRLLRANTPGAYTFILPATRELPKRLANQKRKTIGLRVPDNAIVHGLLAELGEPILSVTFIPKPGAMPLTSALEIMDSFEKVLDFVVDGGDCGVQPTTVVDLETPTPEILRIGKGNPEPFTI